MEPLTTIDIDSVLFNNSVTKRDFIGTFPSCIVPYSTRKCYSFIANVDEHDEKGKHWVSFFAFRQGKKSGPANSLAFFDSFGRKYDDETLPEHFTDIASSFDHVIYSRTRVQGWESVACGYFCVQFLYFMSLGLDYSSFLNEYSTNFEQNDEIVMDFYKSIL